MESRASQPLTSLSIHRRAQGIVITINLEVNLLLHVGRKCPRGDYHSDSHFGVLENAPLVREHPPGRCHHLVPTITPRSGTAAQQTWPTRLGLVHSTITGKTMHHQKCTRGVHQPRPAPSPLVFLCFVPVRKWRATSVFKMAHFILSQRCHISLLRQV